MPTFSTRPARPEELLAVQAEFERVAGSTLPDWDVLTKNAQLFTMKPGADLFLEKPDQDGFHLVLSGLLKATLTTTSGRRRILAFPRAGDVILSISMLEAISDGRLLHGRETASLLRVESVLTAVAPATTVRFEAAAALSLAQRHRAWSTLAIRLLTQLTLLRTLRLNDQLVLSPEERYLKVLRDESALVRQISQRDLALYLGVTPEALSRIASRLRDRRRVQLPTTDASV